jgi:hypothetical protein
VFLVVCVFLVPATRGKCEVVLHTLAHPSTLVAPFPCRAMGKLLSHGSNQLSRLPCGKVCPTCWSWRLCDVPGGHVHYCRCRRHLHRLPYLED